MRTPILDALKTSFGNLFFLFPFICECLTEMTRYSVWPGIVSKALGYADVILSSITVENIISSIF